MSRGERLSGERVPRRRLTEGLGEHYQRGYVAALLVMLAALLYPITGWQAIDDLATFGLLVLIGVPILAVCRVGATALVCRDRSLALIAAGILALLALAVLVPVLLSGGR